VLIINTATVEGRDRNRESRVPQLFFVWRAGPQRAYR